MALVLKTRDPKGSVSSNLTASAKYAQVPEWSNGAVCKTVDS